MCGIGSALNIINANLTHLLLGLFFLFIMYSILLSILFLIYN
nr:MAG TPA: hypothetical protein [Caudoviricetes sp.]